MAIFYPPPPIVPGPPSSAWLPPPTPPVLFPPWRLRADQILRSWDAPQVIQLTGGPAIQSQPETYPWTPPIGIVSEAVRLAWELYALRMPEKQRQLSPSLAPPPPPVVAPVQQGAMVIGPFIGV